MPRKVSTEITQKDKNALNQLKNIKNAMFWHLIIRQRAFLKDFPHNSDEYNKFLYNLKLLLFFIVKRLDNQTKTAKSLKHEGGKAFEDILDKIYADYVEYPDDYSEYLRIIRSSLDTILNLTEHDPRKQLKPYEKCDDYYIKMMKKELAELKDICLNYGLYPYQLIDYISGEGLILNYKINTFEEEEKVCFYLHVPKNDPPVMVKHNVPQGNFFEKERPEKSYYYLENYEDTINGEILKEIFRSCRTVGGSNYDVKRKNNYKLQICVAPLNPSKSFTKYESFIRAELESCFRFYCNNFDSMLYMESIRTGKKDRLMNSIGAEDNPEFSAKQETEYKNINRLAIVYGASKFKEANLSKCVGLLIWDFVNLVGCKNTYIESILASDTIDIDNAAKRFKEEIIKINAEVDADEIYSKLMDVKNVLSSNGYKLQRKFINQDYRRMEEFIDSTDSLLFKFE